MISSPCPKAPEALAPLSQTREVWKACRLSGRKGLKDARRARLKGLSPKEVCRRARAARWGHKLDSQSHPPQGQS